MLQVIDGIDVFVVEFDTIPEFPITYSNEEEKPYAIALAHSIQDGTIKEPGKYGIHILSNDKSINFTIFTIQE